MCENRYHTMHSDIWFCQIAMSSRREMPICLSMLGRKKSRRPSAMRLPQILPRAPLIPILLPPLLMVPLGPAWIPKLPRTRLTSFHLNVHETWLKLLMQGMTKPANSTPEGQSPILNFPHMYGDQEISNQRKGSQGTLRGIERMDAECIYALACRICRRGTWITVPNRYVI